jgi:hypothetical protein
MKDFGIYRKTVALSSSVTDSPITTITGIVSKWTHEEESFDQTEERQDFFHSYHTPVLENRDGKFYHERQAKMFIADEGKKLYLDTFDSICSVHAINAFTGERTATPLAITVEKVISHIKSEASVDYSSLDEEILPYFINGREGLDVRNEGAGDPDTIVNYLIRNDIPVKREEFSIDKKALASEKDLTTDEKADQIYKRISTISEISDRLILSSNGHCVAFRKNTEKKWVLIDSQKEEQEQISPQDYVKRNDFSYCDVIYDDLLKLLTDPMPI